MSTHLELALLTRVILDSDFNALEKAQINESYFTTSEAREIFRYLRDTYHNPQTLGMVPSLDMVRYRYPGFYASTVADQVPVLCTQLRTERVRSELFTLSQELAVRAQTDPASAMAELRSKVSELSALAEVGTDMNLAASYNFQLNRYQTVQQSSGMLGIPYPWAPLNEELQGMQPGQFIIVFGRPKNMKTWVALHIGVNAYTTARRRVLVYTREMHPSLVLQRVTALLAQVDYKAFKNGTLSPELAQHVFEILQNLTADEQAASAIAGSRQPFFIITTDRSAGGSEGGGVSWLRAKIRELQPDLVIVDGMYLMKDDRSNQRTVDWKAITHISQDLKLTAQEFEIPVIGVTQANRAAEKSKGEDLTELSYADALGQDADAVFRVTKKDLMDADTKQKYSEIYLTAPGVREGKFEGIVINAHPGVDFSYKRTIVNLDDELNDGYGQQGKKGGPPPGAPSVNQWRQPSFANPKPGFHR